MRLIGISTMVLVAVSLISFGAAPVRAQEPACSFTVAPHTLSFEAGGGSADLTVTASGPECPFTAVSRAAWITLSPSQGKGSATIRVTVGTNPSQLPRFGSVTVAGKEVRVELWQPKLSGGW